MHGLTKDDSATIGFVLACYFRNAIDNNDLHAWAEHVLATSKDYPTYILELLEFDEPRFHIYKVLGFTPHTELNASEDDALFGITYSRGRKHIDGPPLEKAIAALKKSPQIVSKFEKVFPFIQVQSEV